MRCNSTSSHYTRQTCRTIISVCMCVGVVFVVQTHTTQPIIAHLSRLVSQTRHQPGARGMQPAARNAEIAKGGHEVTIACIRKQRLAGPAPAGGWKLNCDVAKSLLHRRCPKIVQSPESSDDESWR